MSGIGELGELRIIDYLRKNEAMEIYLPLKDRGLDFIGIKNDKYFQIQVKTSLYHKNSYFWFDLYKSKLIVSENTCYIFVCYSLGRRRFMGRSNNFIVVPSLRLYEWFGKGEFVSKANKEDCYNIYIYPEEESGRWLYKNKGKIVDLTHYWNNLSFFY